MAVAWPSFPPFPLASNLLRRVRYAVRVANATWWRVSLQRLAVRSLCDACVNTSPPPSPHRAFLARLTLLLSLVDVTTDRPTDRPRPPSLHVASRSHETAPPAALNRTESNLAQLHIKGNDPQPAPSSPKGKKASERASHPPTPRPPLHLFLCSFRSPQPHLPLPTPLLYCITGDWTRALPPHSDRHPSSPAPSSACLPASQEEEDEETQ